MTALVVVTLAGCLVTSPGRLGPAPRRAGVPGGAATAPAPEALAAYVRAVDAGDPRLERQFLAPGAGPGVLDDVDHLRLDRVLSVVETTPAGGTAQGRHPFQVDVAVEITVRGGDGSLPEGESFPWTFVLVRDRAGDPWTVADGGAG